MQASFYSKQEKDFIRTSVLELRELKPDESYQSQGGLVKAGIYLTKWEPFFSKASEIYWKAANTWNEELFSEIKAQLKKDDINFDKIYREYLTMREQYPNVLKKQQSEFSQQSIFSFFTKPSGDSKRLLEDND